MLRNPVTVWAAVMLLWMVFEPSPTGKMAWACALTWMFYAQTGAGTVGPDRESEEVSWIDAPSTLRTIEQKQRWAQRSNMRRLLWA